MRIALVLLVLAAPALAAERWYEFKGLYVGQDSASVKKLGLTCHRPEGNAATLYDEKCAPATSDDRFSTFGGEKVTTLEAAIKGGKVILIYVKTMGRYGGGLGTAMAGRYGKPKESRGSWQDGSYSWDRGGPEYISLGMHNGVNEVMFGFDDSDIREKQQKRKSAKDF